VKTYLRPLGLVFGADARAQIAAGEAGALGGMAHIAFTQVEVVRRNGQKATRYVSQFAQAKDLPQVRAITTARPAFAGLPLNACRIMGVVNVTPDSFSDGGRLKDTEAAVAHGRKLAEEGADILDVGGESTRPGSDEVSAGEELRRVIPVIEGLAPSHLVSADTRKANVMEAALRAGAKIINDVSGLDHDPHSAAMLANARVPVVLMHALGEPKTMQLNPRYDDVLLDVYDALEEKITLAERVGVQRAQICIDPGIGFGKTFKHNLELLAGLTMFHGLGVALLVGLSRKGFVGAITGENVAARRISGSVGGALHAAMMGAHILRVHDVGETRQALQLFTASADPDSVEF
jgi:dihydropteroate synthase